MRCFRLFAVFALVALSAAVAAAADPVVVELAERATSRTAVVTVGDVAKLAGGDAATRDRIARLDLAEIKPRDPSVSLNRQVVEFRLQLAGIDPAAVTFTGAERITVTAARRPISADEIVAAARAELLRRLPSPDGMTVELAVPIAVRMPEIPAADRPTITAQPHARAVVGPGRVQMDLVVSNGGERLLAFAVQMDVRSAAAAAGSPGPAGVVPAAGVVPPMPPLKAAGTGEVLVKARDRAKMVARTGAVVVTMLGEAQQDGRLGQTITLQNVDSKKTVSGRVVGPGTVEVDIGGAP